jgi:hypothetical protein
LQQEAKSFAAGRLIAHGLQETRVLSCGLRKMSGHEPGSTLQYGKPPHGPSNELLALLSAHCSPAEHLQFVIGGNTLVTKAGT